MSEDRLIITAIDYQRNGVSGVGFHSVEIEARLDGSDRRLIATVFASDYPEDENGEINDDQVEPSDGYCAIQEIDRNGRLVPTGWRGDRFESAIREAIYLTEDERFFTNSPDVSEEERRRVLVIIGSDGSGGWRIEDRIRRTGTDHVQPSVSAVEEIFGPLLAD